MNWYDGIVIDRLWVGHSRFWIIPGTEEIPFVQTWPQDLKKRGILTLIWILPSVTEQRSANPLRRNIRIRPHLSTDISRTMIRKSAREAFFSERWLSVDNNNAFRVCMMRKRFLPVYS